MAPLDLKPGTRLTPTLVVERALGRGGMGSVVLAEDELLDRRVAVKVLDLLSDQESAALRTLLEGRAAAHVVHPHVVAIHAIGEFAGVPYLEMEYVDGGSLRQQMRGPTTTGQAATWLAQLAAALTTAHDAGVVHCDVKPENVLLKQRGLACKLADFGLARSRKDGRADERLSHGTVAYLAPELQHGPPTAHADQFALAVMAVELLTGERPLRTTLDAHCLLPPGHHQPRPVVDVLMRALKREPELRFASCAVFVDALLRALGVPHLRGPLVGMPDVPVADHSRTSLELPILALHLALAPRPLADQVLAALAFLPTGYPGAVREALGVPIPADVVQALRSSGQLDVAGDDLRLAPGVARDGIRTQWAPKQRRQICARAAMAVEACGPKRESTREDATRLYLAARRLSDAARLARESAYAARTAMGRDHHLARAVALLTSQTQPLPWLMALAERVEWLLQCGWVTSARGPLAEAQGVLADVALPAHHTVRIRLLVAGAVMRGATGDPSGASEALGRLVAQLPDGTPADDKTHALAAQGTLLVAAGHAEAAWALLRRELGHPPPPDMEDAVRAHVALQLAAAEAALATKHAGEAAHVAAQAAAQAESLGDGPLCARAFLLLADTAVAQGKRAAATHALQRADAVLRPLGPTVWTARWHVARARQAAAVPDWVTVLQETERAAATFALWGITAHAPELAKWRAQAESALRSS